LLAQVASLLLSAVVAAAAEVESDLPRAGKSAGVPLYVVDFVGSEKWLAWAKSNGCPWTVETCALVAQGGHVEVLMWARLNGRAVHVDPTKPTLKVPGTKRLKL
jgi:hypothetical protein